MRSRIVGLDRACGGKSAVLGGPRGQICGRWAPSRRSQQALGRHRVDRKTATWSRTHGSRRCYLAEGPATRTMSRWHGRGRLGRLDRAGTSLAMSREQASRRSGEWSATRIRAHGPKDSGAGASSPGRDILGIEQRTVVQRGPAGGPATRTRSQSRRESEAGASSLGKNIPGNEQRTGFEVIRRMVGDSERDSWPEGQWGWGV
jgi:hypothetical protein